MTESQLQAYFLARETLRRLQGLPTLGITSQPPPGLSKPTGR